MKNKIYTIMIVLFSVICGMITNDYFLGTVTLACGLLNVYYASIGKTYNYIFGYLIYHYETKTFLYILQLDINIRILCS